MKKFIPLSISADVVKISLLTATAIIISQALSRLVVYHLFRFEIYLALVAVAFLVAGFF